MTYWKQYIKSFKFLIKHHDAFFGLIIIILYSLIAILAPIISLYDPYKINLSNALAPPDFNHPLGCDELGRDIFSRIMYGARLAFYVGLVSVGMAFSIGVFLGLIAGYYEHIIGYIIMRIMDFLLCFPFLLLAIIIVCALGPGLESSIIALGLSLIPGYVRLTYGMTLSTKEEQYIKAATIIGENDINILLRYILPNIISPLVCQATLHLPKVIMSMAALSFLGLGAPPSMPEWGAMISTARDYLISAPHIAIFPGIALMILVLGFNFLGDGLRDFLDPYYRTGA
jgi:peptide/nickel transport system permease protein